MGLLFIIAFYNYIDLNWEKNYGLKKSGFAIGWLLLVTALLCIPGTQFPKITWQNKIWLDKWIHVFLFLILVFLWCRTYLNKHSTSQLKTKFINVTILSIIYGAAMEIVQHYFIPFRSFDYGDMIADTIGSGTGYFISVKRFLRTNRSKKF